MTMYENNQQDATVLVNLLFLVSCTYVGRCFRPSSGTLDCFYSILNTWFRASWFNVNKGPTRCNSM